MSPVPRISGLTVKGFKSINLEKSIEIRPLTILAGANSSGKSSFLQPLLLLKQTLEASGDPGPLQLFGNHVRFTSTDQLLSRSSSKKQCNTFCITIKLSGGESLTNHFVKEDGKSLELNCMEYKSTNENFKIKMNMSNEDILKIIPEPWKDYQKTIKDNEVKWTVVRDRCFLEFAMVKDEASKHRFHYGPGISPSTLFLPHILSLIHLPGLRGNPQRTYSKTTGGPNFQGSFEQYVASVIAQWAVEKSAKLIKLGDNLEELGLAWKVTAKHIDDANIELKVGRLPHSKQGGAQDLVNITDVGFGVSQSLPVVVALLVAKPGQLVYLEQPEIHLHPLAQRRLAYILRDAAKRGVITVVETHSALLLREIQTLVTKEQISKNDVKLHWFTRDEDGYTTISSSDLDEFGSYGKWPEDFDQTELDAEKEYLDAVEIKQYNHDG
ncbi:MAG: DUF3696 domain-containing protein [Candidatus Wallbacteria bacterium]|nr:DUF3696 domain-containing protein [Candidatus Wallbacteria bacterium]